MEYLIFVILFLVIFISGQIYEWRKDKPGWWNATLHLGEFCIICGCPIQVKWVFENLEHYNPKTGIANQYDERWIGCSNEFWNHPHHRTGDKRTVQVKNNGC